jgi:hypothetical protein
MSTKLNTKILLKGLPVCNSSNFTKIFTAFNENYTTQKFKKYKQTFELNEQFRFDVASIVQKSDSIIGAEFKFWFSLASLIKKIPKSGKLKFDATTKRFSQLKLDFFPHLANYSSTNNTKSHYIVRLDYSLNELNSNLNVVKIIKFKLNQKLVAKFSDFMQSHTNEDLHIGMNLQVTFKSGLKRFKLNSKLEFMSDLFAENPALSFYFI